MPMCTVCGEREGEEYFGTFDAPVKDTGERVLVESAEESDIGVAVTKWTGETEEFENWECRACYEDTSSCIVCDGPETCVCEVHNDEALPASEWPELSLEEALGHDS